MSQLRLKKSAKKESIIILCIVLLLGCFILWRVLSVVRNHDKSSIADTNGELDFSLNTLTQEDILSERYGYTMFGSGTRSEGSRTNVGYEWGDEDRDFRSMSAKSFSGVTVLQATQTDSENLILDITGKVDSGNFRMVITVDGIYYDDIEINQTVHIELNNIQNKLVLIKIAGESASFHAEVSRSY